MKRDRNITISNTYGCTTRTTVGRPKKKATKKEPVSFAPSLNHRGPQGPGAEARALMEHYRTKAQETISDALSKGASRSDALRMARNYLKAGQLAGIKYQSELLDDGGPQAAFN